MTTYTRPKAPGTPTWIDLVSPDLDASRAFYRAVFGWEYDVGGPEFGGYTTARVDTRPVAGIGGQMPGAPPAPAFWQLHFATDAIEADVARAVALGAQVIAPPLAVGVFGSMAVCSDPTGARFCFWQAGQHIGTQVADEPGAATWFELYSPDAAASRDFYTALLRADAAPMPGGLEYYVVSHGERQLGGIMQIDPAWGPMPAQWVTYFAVADADETVRRATGHGAQALGAIDPSPFGRLAVLRDPSGATFKILEPPQR
jgi:predicted enzyme related to lactoylglutathione lyase